MGLRHLLVIDGDCKVSYFLNLIIKILRLIYLFDFCLSHTLYKVSGIITRKDLTEARMSAWQQEGQSDKAFHALFELEQLPPVTVNVEENNSLGYIGFEALNSNLRKEKIGATLNGHSPTYLYEDDEPDMRSSSLLAAAASPLVSLWENEYDANNNKSSVLSGADLQKQERAKQQSKHQMQQRDLRSHAFRKSRKGFGQISMTSEFVYNSTKLNER